jgi:excisionase family DNA binding protein
MSQASTALKPFYTITELMARWGVSRMTVYREIKRGRLKRKHIGGAVRFSAEEVARYERVA